MPEPTEPTEEQLAELLHAIIAFEPEFRGVPGWRIKQVARQLGESLSDEPSREEIAAILAWAQARRAAQAEADATDATEPGR